MADVFGLNDGEVDLRHQEVRRGERHGLTWLETRLLRYLLDADQRPVSRDELLQMVWDYSPQTVSRAVDKTVTRLRRKLEVDPAKPEHLVTAFGEGYRLVPATDDEPADVAREDDVLERLDRAWATGRWVALTGGAGIGKSTVAATLEGRHLDPRSDLLELPTEGLVVLDPCDDLEGLLRPIVEQSLAAHPGLRVLWVARAGLVDVDQVAVAPLSLAATERLVATQRPDLDPEQRRAAAHRAGGVPGRVPMACRLPTTAVPIPSDDDAGWLVEVAGFARGAPVDWLPGPVARRLVDAGWVVNAAGRLRCVTDPVLPDPVVQARRRLRWDRVLAAVHADPHSVVTHRDEVMTAARQAIAAGALPVALPLVCALVDAWSREIDVSAEALLPLLPVDHPDRPAVLVRCRLPLLDASLGDALADRLLDWSTSDDPGLRCLAERRLGGLANRDGRDDDALHWLQRSFDGSPDPHLRFGGALPLAAKLADVDPDAALAVLDRVRREAADLGAWARVAQLAAVHAAILDDQGDADTACRAWSSVLGVLDRSRNNQVLYYYVSRQLLAADAPPAEVLPWLAQARARGSRTGEAYLLHALAWSQRRPGLEALALGVPFVSEAVALDAAFLDWTAGGDPEPWLQRLPLVSRQAQRAAATLRAAPTPDALREHFPDVPAAMMWRWWRAR